MSTAPRLLAAGLAALAGAAALNLSLASALQLRPYDVVNVPRGDVARVLALGQRGLIADAYWLSAVQYIGEKRADERGWDKLYPLVDLVTDLDPRHGYAYHTAGIVLSAAGRLDESDAILEKGMAKGPPGWWSYPYYLAFNAWFYRGDYAGGARWAELAARTPGASPNVSQLAVSLASKSGSPEVAVAMLEELRSTARDEATARRLDDQLRLALVERDAQALEREVAALEARRGRPVARLEELVEAGVRRGLPPDPHGGRYVWDAQRREVHSSANPFRFRFRGTPGTPGFRYRPPPGGQEEQQ